MSESLILDQVEDLVVAARAAVEVLGEMETVWEAMTCHETDTLARFADAVGRPDVAAYAVAHHAVGDGEDQGDAHWCVKDRALTGEWDWNRVMDLARQYLAGDLANDPEQE